jgi:hypothetical protein
MVFSPKGLSNVGFRTMTFENTGPRLFFVLEGVPFWGGGSPRGNVSAGMKVVIGRSSFPLVEPQKSAVPVVITHHRRPASEGCREQL